MRFNLGTKQQRSSRGIPGSFCYLLLITVKQAKLLCKGNARGINGISHNAFFFPKSSVVRFEIITIGTFRVAHNFKLHILALHHNNGKLKDVASDVSVPCHLNTIADSAIGRRTGQGLVGLTNGNLLAAYGNLYGYGSSRFIPFKLSRSNPLNNPPFTFPIFLLVNFSTFSATG